MADGTGEDRPSVRQGMLITGLGTALLVVLLAVAVPWDWLPSIPGGVPHVPATDVFTVDQIERAKHFAWPQRILGWSSLAVSLLVTCLLGLTRRGRSLVARAPGPWWVATPLAVLTVLAAGEVATAPLSAWARHRAVEAGLSTQSLGGWARDQLTSLGVAWALTSLAMLVVVGLGRRAPRTWPVWLAGSAVVMTALGSFLHPVVIEPLFNDFKPMPAGDLRSAILDMAKTEGVDLDEVLVADASRRTTTLNAYVSGFGDTRRVVVYDNLLTDAPRDETLLVIAHELGHARDHDVAIGTTLGALGVVIGIGLLSLLLGPAGARSRRLDGVRAGDLAVVPMVLALSAVATLAASPVQSTVSRAMEARADRTSLEVTHDEQAFVDLHRRLALTSLGDPSPPRLSQFWFGSHPTVLQRVGIARALAGAETEGQ